MASALKEAIGSALSELQDQLASDGIYDTFTWRPDTGPVEIRCVRNMQGESVEAVIGGKEGVADFALNVLTEYFLTVDTTLVTIDSTLYTADNDTPRPVAGMKLEYRGKRYKVAKAELDTTGAYIRITLADRYSGR